MNDTQPEVVTVDGEEFYQWKTVLRVPKNWTPESGVFIAVAPPGGIANFPAAVQGDPGLPPTLRNVEMVELDHDDPTPASAEWTLIAEGSATVRPVYDLTLTLHRGEPGAEATMTILDADDLEGTLIDGYILQVTADEEGGGYHVEMVAQKVGDLYWPTTVTTLTDATGANGIAQVTIPTQPGPYRLCVEGQQIVSYDGTDVQVDLVARLGGTGTGSGATDGSVIARGQGLPGSAALMQNLVFSPSPPVASTAGFGEVSDGASRVVYIRCEQVGSGVDTYDTVAGRGLFSVRVEPLR